jgi:hypothetical protein
MLPPTVAIPRRMEPTPISGGGLCNIAHVSGSIYDALARSGFNAARAWASLASESAQTRVSNRAYSEFVAGKLEEMPFQLFPVQEEIPWIAKQI